MLEAALRYPLESDDRVAIHLLGAVLLLTSVLVLPAIVLQGYLVRVLRSSASGESAAPSFTDWGGLFVDGLKLFVVQFVYGAVLVVPFLVVGGVVLGGLGALTGGEPSAAVGATTLLFAALFALAAVAVAYVVPAALTNLALEGRLAAAFAPRVVLGAAFTTEYLVGVLLGVGLVVVIGAVASPLTAVLVGFPLLFYGQVVLYYCFGRGFANATGGDRGVAEGAGAEPI